MKIGELTKKTGLSADAIRFYEKQGLLKSADRTEGGYREFRPETVEVLTFISKCRALDISLPEIKKLLQVKTRSAKSCREANLVIEEHLASLRARIKALKNLETQLAELKSVCNQDLAPDKCAIIKALS